jgi:two-component system phosphate regulon response regulator PhoB
MLSEADAKPETGSGAQPEPALAYLEVTLWPNRRQAAFRGQELRLTPTEFRLLEIMLKQPGRPFSRRELMNSAIGGGAIVLERTIDVHIKSLRHKLGDADLIQTVRRVGYRFREKPPT